MSEKFVASSGVFVDLNMHGEIGFNGKGVRVDDQEVDALREFFLHERDTELGRWRWPENPDLIVYKILSKTGEDTGDVRVTSEATGYAMSPFGRDGSHSGAYGAAAHAYFDAHPEPKPWKRAEPGEVWVLTYRNIAGDETTNPAIRTFAEKWRIPMGEYDFMDPIVAGRRIFPEVVSDDS